MPTVTMAAIFSFRLTTLTPHSATLPSTPLINKRASLSLNLSSSRSICSPRPLVLTQTLNTSTSLRRNPQPPMVVCAKGYKMKTHKASAKRFRVTGSGKIMRRRAGKQHLLRKKNTKRRLRLSKSIQVDRSDYDNVIGALPYLKVNRAN
ncbi:50S ribosomal protein L35, chloroplastic-like [Salvia splendens]|uniref:50S ribosomal protein L35, chloroplastic-like n=1 Tax=Salvia splendens TaxID=180675 RepID=UPI001C25C661|nr:50S ribosomal protein L35, chloroplastic-like [Salvia splendens]